MFRFLGLLFFLLALTTFSFAQSADGVPPEARARLGEVERLYQLEAPRWGDRVRAGKGSTQAIELFMQGIRENNPRLIEQALEAAIGDDDRYGQGHILYTQAIYVDLTLDERISKLEKCLDCFEGLADPLLCAYLRYLVGVGRLNRGDNALGFEHFQKAMPAFEASGLGEMVAECSLGLGNCLANMEKPEQAILYLDHAVAGFSLAQALPRMARAQFMLGITFLRLNRFAQATLSLKECRDGYDKLGDLPSVLAVEVFLASVKERQGYLAEALSYYQSINSRAKNANFAWALNESSAAIARVLANQGRYEEARLYYDEAIKNFTAAGNMAQVALTRHTLALLYYSHGRFQDAESLMLENLQALKEAKQWSNLSAIALTLTKLYFWQGRYEEAYQSFAEAVAPHLDEEMPKEEISLPLRLWYAGEHEKALKAYRKLLAKLVLPSGDSNLVQLKSYFVTAMIEQRRYKEAIDSLRELIEIDVKGTDKEPLAWIELAKIYLDNSQPDLALDSLKRAKPLVERAEGQNMALIFHQALARAYKDIGNLPAAKKELEEARLIYAQLQKAALYSGGLSSAIGMSRTFWWICGQLAQERLAAGDIEGAFLATESGRDRILAASQIRSQHFDSPKARSLRAQLAKAVQTLQLARDSATTTTKDLEKYQEACDSLEISLLKEAQAFQPLEPDMNSIKASLSKSDALVSFVWLDDELHGFLLKPTGVSHKVLKWSQQDSANLLAVLSTDASSDEAQGLLVQGYAQLIAPFADLLGDVKSLAICPDGNLQVFPFEALIDGHGHYLIKSFEVTYLTSARGLSATGSKTKLQALVMGGADFGEPQSTGNSWHSLPGSKLEAELVARALGAKPLLGAFATKDKFKALAPKSSIIHFASHAFSGGVAESSFLDGGDSALVGENARNPYLDSGLVFAGANKANGREIGVLSGYDVLEMDLSKVELAVLSACETGSGKATSGEGVLGLRRAFQAAGVGNLITSLWPVEDRATASFMSSFYENFESGMSPMQALAACKRAQIEDGFPPSVWAAFVLTGPLRLDY